MGRCIFCGQVTDTRPVKLSANFTAYQYLQAGDGACETCYKLYKDPSVRRRSWVWDSQGLRFVDNPLEILLNPPEPPFRIYLTRTGKKHGWIRVADKLNHDKDLYWVAYDENLILVDRAKLKELVDFARKLRGLGLKKSELKSGNVSVKSLEKLDISDYRALKSLKGNVLWGLVVDFVE